MKKMIGSSKNLMEKYNKFIYEEPSKNDQSNESSILNKRFNHSLENNIFIIFNS